MRARFDTESFAHRAAHGSGVAGRRGGSAVLGIGERVDALEVLLDGAGEHEGIEPVALASELGGELRTNLWACEEPLQRRLRGVVAASDTGADPHLGEQLDGGLAARMEQLADPGTTFITAAILELAEGYVEVIGHRDSVSLAEAYLAGRRLDHALAAARSAVQRLRAAHARGSEGHALRLLGDVHGARGEADQAEAAYREALTIGDELGMRPLVARCHLGLGGLHRDRGRRHEARQHLEAAHRMLSDMDMRYWGEQAKVALGELV